MRATLACFALLLVVPAAGTAPAPDPGPEPRQKLEALKKRLPAILGKWVKENHATWPGGFWSAVPEVRLLRRIAPARAKLVVLFVVFDKKGMRVRHPDVLLTVFLAYHDGCWTTEQFEVDSLGGSSRAGFAFLIPLIDEAGEK